MKFTGLFIGIAKHTVAKKTTYTQPRQKETQDVEQSEILQWLQALARFCVVAPKVWGIINLVLCLGAYAIITFPTGWTLSIETIFEVCILLAAISPTGAMLVYYHKMHDKLQPEIIATNSIERLNVIIGSSTAVTTMMFTFTAAYIALLVFVA